MFTLDRYIFISVSSTGTGMAVGQNGNNRWEWEGNGNENKAKPGSWNGNGNKPLGMGGNGIKKSFPLISTPLDELRRSQSLTYVFTGASVHGLRWKLRNHNLRNWNCIFSILIRWTRLYEWTVAFQLLRYLVTVALLPIALASCVWGSILFILSDVRSPNSSALNRNVCKIWRTMQQQTQDDPRRRRSFWTSDWFSCCVDYCQQTASHESVSKWRKCLRACVCTTDRLHQITEDPVIGLGNVVTFELFELYYWLELYELYYGRPA